MEELIRQGGPIVSVLIVLAFFGTLFTLERFLFFHRVRINVGDLLIGLANHLRKKDFADAMHEANRAPGPVARVCHAVLMRHSLNRSDLRAIAQEAGQLEIPRIEQNLRAILTIAMIAPLVGMLGTVLGLTEVFNQLQEQNHLSSNDDFPVGFAQALITTALGLTIAIPMYLLYLFFYSKAKRLSHKIERAGIEIVNLVFDAKTEPSPQEEKKTAT